MLDDKILPMLAYHAAPFDSARHLFEIKWDGTRCLLFVKGTEIRLQNRRLENITRRYPEFRGAYRDIKARNAILDGELVVLREGLPDFHRLQQREQAADPLKIDILAQRLPATYMVFDVLYHNDTSCLDTPLETRKVILSDILGESAHLVESRVIRQQGKAFFQEAVGRGLEGIMAKSLVSPYLIGRRSRYWLKIKPRLPAVCAVVGYTPGQGARQGSFGALLLATPGEGGWQYRGKVGSGFRDADLEEISRQLRQLRVDAPPFPRAPGIKGVHWVRPILQVEINYQEETPGGRFRAPAFLRVLG